jgi:CHAT domain-containing protein/tetratricopeptide (TPR) repeat protein
MSRRQRHAATSVALFMLAMSAGMVARPGVTAQVVAAQNLSTVGTLIDAGHYAEAEELAERLHRQAGSGRDSLAAAETLVAALVRNGRGGDSGTRELAESVVRGRAVANPAQPQLLATALDALGDVLFQAGDYRLAVSKFREGLAIREKTGDTTSPELATNLEHLAQALTDVLVADAAAANEALGIINRALAIRQSIGAPAAIARAHRIRSLAWQNSGNYVRARADAEEALTTFQQVMREPHPEIAAMLAHLGEQLAFAGALVPARATLERACTMAEITLREGHPELATCLRSFAVVDEELGDLSAAKSRRERGLAITEASLGAEHPRFAVQLNDLAINFQGQGEFATARSLYERARAIYERRLGVDSNAAIVVTFNLGLLHTRMGTYVDARRAFDRVIVTWTRILGPQSPNLARALSAMAELLADQQRYAEARVFYTRALRIRERALGAGHPYVGRTLSNLAWTIAQLRQPREALTLSNRALRIWEQSGAREGLSEALVTHAQILSRTGDDAGADVAFRRALDIRIELFGSSHPLIGETEVALASVEMRLGNPTDALDRALRGERIGREHSRLTLGYLAEREALDYVAKRQNGLDVALSLAASEADRRAVFDELVRGRSLALDEIGARRRVIAETQGGEASDLWTRLRVARQRLANRLVRGPGNASPEQYSVLIEEARAQKEAAERALAAKSATFRTSARNAEASLEDVRRALPEGAALVSFVRYNHSAPVARTVGQSLNRTLTTSPSYMAFVLRSDRLEPTLVPLGSALQIEGAISAWRRDLMMGPSAQRGELVQAERVLRVPGTRLRRRIWDPVSTHLKGATHVFVVPDSAINLVPFAALPDGTGGYLVEHEPVIHYLSAERDVTLLFQPDGGAQTGGLLVVGGPTFAARTPFRAFGPKPNGRPTRDVTAKTNAPDDTTTPEASGFRGTYSQCVTFQNMRFSALPAAAREAQDVATLWKTLSVTGSAAAETLIGAAATESAVKHLGPGSRILHLATHGFFLGDECASPLDGARAVGGLVSGPTSPNARRSAMAPPENPLVLSGLALAGANLRAAAGADEDDGILTAEEVASLNLTGVEWAVLSACDTGLGLIRAGEGVLGLRRAFHLAGARTVIMSLWSVEDRATRQWMQTLYSSRLESRRSTADAVRDAALAVLRERRARGLSGHPFFWAGFVAAGDWR